MNAALSQEIDSGATRVLPLMVGSHDDVQRMTDELVIERDKRYIRSSGDPVAIEVELRALLRRENAKAEA